MTIKLGLVGTGTVGGGCIDILQKHKEDFKRHYGIDVELARVCCACWEKIASRGGSEVVNRDIGRCFGIIHLKTPYHRVIEIEKALRRVREGCLTVIDAVKRNARVMLFTLSYPLRAHFIRNFVGNLQYSFLAPV